MSMNVVKTARLAEIDELAGLLSKSWKRPATRRDAVDAAVVALLHRERAKTSELEAATHRPKGRKAAP